MRILHTIIATNIVLKEMGVAADIQCNFCKDEKDRMEHIIWTFVFVRHLWNSLEMTLKENCQIAANKKLQKSLYCLV